MYIQNFIKEMVYEQIMMMGSTCPSCCTHTDFDMNKVIEIIFHEFWLIGTFISFVPFVSCYSL
jgi:hypothetical protein